MAVATTINVVLADDHAMVREALAQILEESGCLRVVGQAANGPAMIDTVAKTRPEVLVLDYTMPDLDTPHAIESLVLRWPALKVVVLTVHENIHYAVKVLESGAHGDDAEIGRGEIRQPAAEFANRRPNCAHNVCSARHWFLSFDASTAPACSAAARFAIAHARQP